MPELAGRLTRDQALEIFNVLAGLGYACAVKHRARDYTVEVPVRLSGDKAYGKEAEIVQIAMRAGFVAVQTGHTLRIIGR